MRYTTHLKIKKNLHSNMVRFIIGDKALAEAKNWLFTFQYG